MTDKVQKIREEIERLKGWNNNVRNSTRHMTLQEEDFNRGKHSSYLEILNFIDSLQEEPVGEDLGEVANKYGKDTFVNECMENGVCDNYDLADAFKAGAKWQKKQMMANTADAMIGLPYENKDGGYTHIIDVSRPLPVGNNKIAIIFKEE